MSIGDRAAHGRQLARELVLDRLLDLVVREHGAVLLFALGRGLPREGHVVPERLDDGVELGRDRAEPELGRGLDLTLAKHDALHDRATDQLAVARHRDCDPERGLDRAVLAQEHVEHDAVDRVVRAVQGQRAHNGPFLSVAIDAALALLVPGRVPRKVVVDHRGEPVLQVDALGQAIGAHQDPARRLVELGDATLSLLGDQRAIDCLDRGALELLAQVLRDVGDGRNEPAEHDRRVAVFEELVDDALELPELLVVLAGESLGGGCQVAEPASLRITIVAHRPRRHVDRLEGLVVEIEHGAAALEIDRLQGLEVGVAGALAQRGRCGGRAR